MQLLVLQERLMNHLLSIVMTAAAALVLAGSAHTLAAPPAQIRPTAGKGPLVSKDPWDQGQTVVIPLESRNTSACVQECLMRNRMVSSGIERIEEGCREECGDKDEGITTGDLLRSGARSAYIQALSESDDPKVVPALIAALEREFDDRTGLWAWIIPALGRLRDPRAVPVLVEALRIEDMSWLGREAAAKALGRIGQRAAVPALLWAADRGDTRDAAIQALATIGDPRATEVLIGALASEEAPETRKAAIAGLKALGLSAVPTMIKAFGASLRERESPQTRARLALCRLLADSGDPRALQALHAGRQDPDPRIAACARRFTVGSPVPSDAGAGR